jgi:hypothetical protein
MASIFKKVLSEKDIQYLINLLEVRESKVSGSTFYIQLTDSIRSALIPLGMDLSQVSKIPMRWMNSDTAAHIDTGSRDFAKTFLVYLNDSTGEFIIGSDSYAITANTAFVFNEGISHKTVGTESRLLIGPMSEFAEPVGLPSFTPQSVNYFPTQTDAQNITNLIYQSSAFYIDNISNYVAWAVDSTNTISTGYNSLPYTYGEDLPVDGYNAGDGFGQYYIYPVFLVYYANQHDLQYDINQLGNSSSSYTLVTIGSFSNWIIHSSSTGSSSQSGVYPSGATLSVGGTYFLLPAPSLVYYASESNALSGTNPIGNSTSYTISRVGGFGTWKLASNSTGSSSQSGVYGTGLTLAADGFYYLYPNVTCLLEGSKILCQVDGQDTYIPIETIKPGTLVKTRINGYKPVVMIGKSQMQNPGDSERIENRLYKCSPSKYPELTDDLYITGCHSILVGSLTDIQREKTKKYLGKIFVTEQQYRLMSCVDERAEPWNSEGMYTVWHLALENTDIYVNSGMWANGLLVETCSIHVMKTRSNMTIN